MKLAIVRIRGLTGVKSGIKQTLDLLRLYRKNYCVVVEGTPSMTGMIKKVKDYVTWGEISDATYKTLVEKRGTPFVGRTEDKRQTVKYKFVEINGKKLKPFFTLSPPRGGFERKGTKMPYSNGGALGYRGEKINALLAKMI